MIQIDMEMPKNCYECRIRLVMGCQIANASGWLNNRRDKMCPLKEVPNNAGWINVKDAMPSERETIFAKFKGTDKWNPAMFATSSEDVRVIVQFEDGTRRVWHDNTMDGKWKCEREKCAYPKRTVTHWMPNPELPKEE